MAVSRLKRKQVLFFGANGRHPGVKRTTIVTKYGNIQRPP